MRKCGRYKCTDLISGKWGNCDNEEEESHTCPFAVDVNDDYRECNCCNECKDRCRDDI